MAFSVGVDMGDVASVGGSVAIADASLGAMRVGDPVGMLVGLELVRILG